MHPVLAIVLLSPLVLLILYVLYVKLDRDSDQTEMLKLAAESIPGSSVKRKLGLISNYRLSFNHSSVLCKVTFLPNWEGEGGSGATGGIFFWFDNSQVGSRRLLIQSENNYSLFKRLWGIKKLENLPNDLGSSCNVFSNDLDWAADFLSKEFAQLIRSYSQKKWMLHLKTGECKLVCHTLPETVDDYLRFISDGISIVDKVRATMF